MQISFNINFIKKRCFLLWTLVFMQVGVLAQSYTVSGPSSSTVGDTEDYSLGGGTSSIINTSWNVSGTGEGTVISSNNSSATITFTEPGNAFVDANIFDIFYSSHNAYQAVSIAPAPPQPPGNPIIVSNECGEATLQRSGTPPSGVRWYWQGKNSNGTSTSLGYGTTFIADQGSGIYYIRARDTSTGLWSTTSEGKSVTINTSELGPVQITGLTSICKQFSSDYDVSVLNATNLTWEMSPAFLAGQINASTGEVEWDVLFSGEVIITVTASNQCGYTATGSLTIDKTAKIYFYLDKDRDGFYTTATRACTNPDPLLYVTEEAILGPGDCDDEDDTLNPNTLWYLDVDGDGHSLSSVRQCDPPPGSYVRNVDGTVDCDDNNPNVHLESMWFLDADGDGHAISSGLYCGSPGAGYTTLSMPVDDCNDGVYDPSNNCAPGNNEGTSENYVFTREYQTAQTVAPSFFTQNSNLIQQITYYDAIGRPSQSLGLQQSPLINGVKKDIITHIDYDGFGRQSKEWLPYVSDNEAFGGLKNNSEQEILEYYNSSKYENTLNPYSEKKFDDSPLNRVEQQAAPGNDWALGSGHEIEFEYAANSANEVRRFEVNLNGGPSLILGGSGVNEFYASNQLRKNIIFNENHSPGDGKNHTSEEFIDKEGRVVLKRMYANSGAQNEVAHDTYYVYDIYGNLTFVLPPKMDASTNSISTLQAQLNELGYQYIYDTRNRLIEKKIPGKGWEYIVYDRLDRPIMTQDANMRVENNPGLTRDQWLFTKYDVFGRVAYTGKASDHRSRNSIQGIADSRDIWVERSNARLIAGTTIYYNIASYPYSAFDEIHTINYYDDYDFDRSVFSASQTAFGVTSSSNVQGLVTGTKIRVLGTNNWITTITYYDEKARPIYTASKNDYLGTEDRVATQLDFVGRPTKVRTYHNYHGGTVTLDTFTYDHTGRLLTQTQCMLNGTLDDSCPSGNAALVNPTFQNETVTTNQVATTSITILPTTTISGTVTLRIDPNAMGDSGQELIVDNTYDELGQLERKNVGGDANGNGLQAVDYSYNVRGWLTGINDTNDTDATLTKGVDDLFAFRIAYNEGVSALYNGNIARTQWQTENQDATLKTYDYTYDPFNRITSATDNTGNYNLHNVTYDKNGNIITLSRKGHIVQHPTLGLDANNDGQDDHFGTMDDITFSYSSGNKLMKATDWASVNDYGFKDDAIDPATDYGDDYLYDVNGNMILDDNKGITAITYNHLNLPTQITMVEGTISYIYDATGTKLQKTVGSSVTDYAGNHVYEDGNLQFFNHPEGYVTPDGSGGYDYVYQYKDHLGNVRLSYADSNNDGQIDASTEIISEKNYYPFGLEHKGYNSMISPNVSGVADKFKFNGIELENALGLDLYEMEVRHYDPAIARFTSIDPVVHFNYSTYQAFDNNPVFWIDPSGANAQVGADGLTNEQWIALSRPGGGGFDAMRAQARQNFQDEIEQNKRATAEAGEGKFLVTGDAIGRPKRVHQYMQADELIVNLLLWAIYVNQNQDERIRASEIVDHRHNKDLADHFEDGLGGDSGANIQGNKMIRWYTTGRAFFGYQSSLVNNEFVDWVSWGRIGKFTALRFLTEPVKLGIDTNKKNKIPAIWLKFENAPRSDRQNLMPGERGDGFYRDVKRVFDPRSGIYDVNGVRYLQWLTDYE